MTNLQPNHGLQARQEKIQTKRKQTPWRDFVRDICSWMPLSMNKAYDRFSRYPKTDRILGIVSKNSDADQNYIDYSGNLGSDICDLMKQSSFLPVLQRGNNENSHYADIVLNSKNIYLSVAAVGVQNVLYSWSVKHQCENIFSSLMIRNGSTNVFESSSVINSFNVFYSQTIQGSNNIRFSQNLIGCSECISCFSLQNESYCINNKKLNQEEYFLQKDKILSDKNNFDGYKNALGFVRSNQGSQSCIGNSILNSQDVIDGYYSNNIIHAHNVIFFGSDITSSYIYDAITGGSPSGAHIYGGVSNSGEHIYCGLHCEDCSHVYYSYDIENCSFCLGCIGLKNKSYCILNKQYTKEERYEKVDEIFTQMEQTPSNSPLSGGGNQLGEFFPASMNPFYFNDTAAYLIDPSFTKEEVTKLGYLRRDEPIKVDIPEGAITVKSEELSVFESFDEQGNRKLDETVCKRVIIDENRDAYRIIPMELEFLQKHGLPLPRKHRLTRMKENFRIN